MSRQPERLLRVALCHSHKYCARRSPRHLRWPGLGQQTTFAGNGVRTFRRPLRPVGGQLNREYSLSASGWMAGKQCSAALPQESMQRVNRRRQLRTVSTNQVQRRRLAILRGK